MELLNKLWSFQFWIFISTCNTVQGLDSKRQEKIEQFVKKNTKASYFYGPPVFTDDDKGSWLMPRAYECDGCVAVAYRFEKEFAQEETLRFKKGQPLSESHVIDVVDKVCKKGFTGFGIKNYNGKNRLSGPGLRVFYEPGITAGGESWIERLRGLCMTIVGKFEEEAIYEMYRSKEVQTLAQMICQTYCTDEELKDLEDDHMVVNKMSKLEKEDF